MHIFNVGGTPGRCLRHTSVPQYTGWETLYYTNVISLAKKYPFWPLINMEYLLKLTFKMYPIAFGWMLKIILNIISWIKHTFILFIRHIILIIHLASFALKVNDKVKQLLIFNIFGNFWIINLIIANDRTRSYTFLHIHFWKGNIIYAQI